MGAKQINLPVLAILPFIVGVTLSIMLMTQPATAAVPSLSVRNAAPAVTDTPTCTPPAWTVTTSPNVGTGYNQLYGIDAASANDIWAVGYYCGANCTSSDPSQTLVEHWDGTAWSMVPSPNIGTGSNSLLGVAVLSPNEVWAVGSYTVGATSKTLIERWDGSAWTVVASPSVGTGSNNLTGVAVVSANDIWAVGYSCSNICIGSPSQTLIEHWNGNTWEVISSPNVGTESNALNGASALGDGTVWAVGIYRNNNVSQTLVERWNGSVWEVVSSPNVGSNPNVLTAVAAVSPNDAWAVGYFDGNIRQTLIERWDGNTWSVITSPNPGTGLNRLNGVIALSADDAWAVGYYCSGCGSSNTTLVLHWSGDDWHTVSSPNEGTGQNNLYGVAATSANDTWAVGTYYQNSTYQTLTEHWYGTPCACSVSFNDVHPSDYFYEPVRSLYCAGVISGYSDGMFHPSNNTSRGQLAKIVVLAKGWTVECPMTEHFTDVPRSSVFFCFVETALSHNLVSGYSDGTFGLGNDVTRAQLCKIIVQAQQWPTDATGGPHFTDVPQTDPFYGFIETAYNHGVVSGYADRTFAPGNSATRGQICKIVYQATAQP